MSIEAEMMQGPPALPRIQSLSELEDAGSAIPSQAQEILVRERARAEHSYQHFPDLVARLLYVAVAGVDHEYIDRFLLTYRRFATPRALLLRLQLRFRELAQGSSDVPDCVDDFARFRLCTLLEYWTKLYPTDFYAPGTSGAFKALYKTISGMPDLVHYAIKLEPFVRDVCDGNHSRYEDPAWEWAVQETDRGVLENDILDDQHYSSTIIEELEIDMDNALGPDPEVELVSISQTIPEEEEVSFNGLTDRQRSNSTSSNFTTTTSAAATPIASVFTHSSSSTMYTSTASLPLEQLPRKLSSASPTLSSIPEPEYVPFPTGVPVSTPSPVGGTPQRTTRSASVVSTHSQVLKVLNSLLPQVMHTYPVDIAQEITRIQLALFLKIEPRDWIRHVLVKPDSSDLPFHENGASLKTIPGRRRNGSEHIWEFVNFYNHLASWVTSLILTHPLSNTKARVRTAARFILIARELRALHNYSGLRAVVCGIMNATVEGDEMITMMKEGEFKDLWKSLGSYIILMSSSKGHRHYRTAVSNVICGVIPESEIHTSDLQRTVSVQTDYHKDDPTRINWGKFARVGGIIEEMTACQKRCRRSVINRKFAFPERSHIRRWIEETEIMDAELLDSRMPPIERNMENGLPSNAGTNSPPQNSLQRIANLFKA